jgi:NADH-quinone oxidoreductase subunit C
MTHAAVSPHPEAAAATPSPAALGDLASASTSTWVKSPSSSAPPDYLERPHPARRDGCQFEQLIDVCGVDYSEYRMGDWDGPRYAVDLAPAVRSA